MYKNGFFISFWEFSLIKFKLRERIISITFKHFYVYRLLMDSWNQWMREKFMHEVALSSCGLKVWKLSSSLSHIIIITTMSDDNVKWQHWGDVDRAQYIVNLCQRMCAGFKNFFALQMKIPGRKIHLIFIESSFCVRMALERKAMVECWSVFK